MAEFVEAKWIIPHCDFEQTPTGFRVSYTKNSVMTPAKTAATPLIGMVILIVAAALGIMVGVNSNSFGMALIVFFAVVVGGVFFGGRALTPKYHTRIEVTGDAIIIENGSDGEKRLRRGDFGNFHVAHTVTNQAGSAITMGYSYGNQSFEIKGAWKEREANEFLSALNRYVRLVPSAEQQRTSPEVLRSARPSDF